MKYTGGCHCGKVRFEVEMQIENGLVCNCSICSKRGSILAFTGAENFKLLSGSEVLNDYQFGKKAIHHRFCSHCGILSFGESEHGGQPMKAINIRCLDDIDLDKIPLQYFDGKSI